MTTQYREIGSKSNTTNLAGGWVASYLSSLLLLTLARPGILGWMKATFLHSLAMKQAQGMRQVDPQIPLSCVWSQRWRDTF